MRTNESGAGRPDPGGHPAVARGPALGNPLHHSVVPPLVGPAVGISRHAWVRLMERLTPAEQQALLNRVTVVEHYGRRHAQGHDWGIRLLRLGSQRNETWSEASNGDEVWAILRRGEIKTIMLRRSSQPATAAALRVDKVVFL